MFPTPEDVRAKFDPRRVRRWVLPPHELIRYMNQLFNPNGIKNYVSFKATGLPEGFTVIDSSYLIDPWRIAFYIQHPSFDVVEDGQIPPLFDYGSLVMELIPYYPAQKDEAVEKAAIIAEAAEPFIGKEWAVTLADEIRRLKGESRCRHQVTLYPRLSPTLTVTSDKAH